MTRSVNLSQPEASSTESPINIEVLDNSQIKFISILIGDIAEGLSEKVYIIYYSYISNFLY